MANKLTDFVNAYGGDPLETIASKKSNPIAFSEHRKTVVGTNDVFSKILNDGYRSGKVPNKTKDARDWFRKRAQEAFTSRTQFTLLAGRNRKVKGVELGKMYFYFYDPKTKDVLPYYDTFPCVIPIDFYNDGFLGLNLHYLPLSFRAKLMDGLYQLVSNKKYDANTIIRANYQLLNGASRLRWFKPCVKRYLYGHVRSQFYAIQPDEWDIALYLPWQGFKKASDGKVWSDSIKKIG